MDFEPGLGRYEVRCEAAGLENPEAYSLLSLKDISGRA